MRQQGRIAKWNDERGFGFIAPSEGANTVFVHISSFPRSDRRPSLNDAVSYTLAFDSHGRPQANDVRFTVGSRSASPMAQVPRWDIAVPIAFAISFLLALIAFAVVGWLEISWLALHYGASIITYIVYARDKKAAQNAGWRTPELTLHLMSLVGGWPGALIAQVLLRHKTRKLRFQVPFVLASAMGTAILLLAVLRP